jgi:hypothetical protein
MKQRARKMSDQNRPPPPAVPAVPAAEQPVAAAPAAIKMTSAQKDSIKQVQADLDEIKPKAQATADQKSKLQATLEAAAAGPDKPDHDTVVRLANDLAAGWPSQKLSDDDKGQLASQIVLLLNIGSLNADPQPTLQKAQNLLKTSGIPPETAQKIINDLKCVVADIKSR